MNRSNISKQLNYGDLSRFVGKPVGQQFAKKRYAEGETVAEELTGSVTYEDINGKKRTYRYNPNTHTKPQPSGRMRRTNIDYTQLANNPGMSIFDRATLAEEPAAVIARQQQNVPVSITEDFWSEDDIETIGDFVDNKQGGFGTGPDAMKKAEERAASARKFGMMLPFGGLGGLAPRFLSNMSWANTKEGIDKGIGPELLGLTEEGKLAESGGVDKEGNPVKQEATVAAFQKDMEDNKATADKYKDTSKMEGDRKASYERARAAQALQNAWAFGKSMGRDIAKDGTLTDDDIKGLLGLSGIDPSVGGGQMNQPTISQLDSWSDPNDGMGITAGVEGQEQAAADAAAAAAWKQSVDEASSIDVEGLNMDVGTAMEDYSDEDGGLWMAKGGIAQLAPGGIAPSDKHLDPGSFVISADVVSGVGDGSTESGIERMSGLLGIPLDGSVSGPDGSMLGRVTTADGPVPGTGLSDSVSTVIQDTDTVRLNVGNNPLKQMTPQGKTAARVARDELVVDTKTIANLPQMFMGAKGPDLKQGQQMLTNFMDNVRANKTNTGGKQPGPLVPEGQDVMKGLASLFQRA